MSNLTDRLTQTHPEAEAVTLLCSAKDYQQIADEAFSAELGRSDVRSHNNSDAPEDKPAVSIYFDLL